MAPASGIEEMTPEMTPFEAEDGAIDEQRPSLGEAQGLFLLLFSEGETCRRSKELIFVLGNVRGRKRSLGFQ